MISAATEPLLGVLKYVLLALLYLFFARVLWAVWSEVRGPRGGVAVTQPARGRPSPSDPTVAAPVPDAASISQSRRAIRAPRGKRGTVGRFVITEPKSARGSAFAINEELTIGRAATCTIGMPDDSFVSQLHARVYRDAGLAMIEDLGSTNGTYVNGKRLTKPEQVTKGDRVQIGSTVFEVE
ncbi:MAG TPA: FHA domain-containing protein [Ilumatobacteraceae bacterium]|nr:FHA domain-containing protein [Ilumatobacteraceae bacterium]